MIEFIIENKHWIFSGIGIFIFSTLINFLHQKNNERKKDKFIKVSKVVDTPLDRIDTVIPFRQKLIDVYH
ncbi:MAG: hypothetical protein AB8B69_11365, partial [Chitinophagales bacterium]